MQISPGKNDNLHLVTATSTVQGPGSIGLSLVWQSRPPMYGLICGFCSSARNFAHWRTFQAPQSGFLQIPPHDGHPCLRLTVPATESVVDFHHQVVAHAGRTKKTPRADGPGRTICPCYHPSSREKRALSRAVTGAPVLPTPCSARLLRGDFGVLSRELAPSVPSLRFEPRVLLPIFAFDGRSLHDGARFVNSYGGFLF